MPSKKSAPTSSKNILINVDKRYKSQLSSIADKLRSAGMNVSDVFPLAGTIAGEVSIRDFDKLREIEGVASVEEEPVFHAY